MDVKKGESSLTALISAFGRAYHSQFDTPKIFDDFLAKQLMTQEEYDAIKTHMVQGISFFNPEMAEQHRDNPDEILKWITQVQLSPTPLARAAYCEAVLQKEIESGVRQYVILGAGMDTFAQRYPELKNRLEIFELDHPFTQTFKLQRLQEAGFEIPDHLHFIACDFTKPFSYEKLYEKGFGNQKTFFSLLGVSYYLTKEELAGLLGHLFANVPAGSSIVFDYADERLFEEKGFCNRVENMVKMAAAAGEPMKSCFSLPEMENMLEKPGLRIVEHLSPVDIQERYFRNRNDHLSACETIHFLHAVKREEL